MKYRIMHIDDNYDALKLLELKFKNSFEIASVQDPEEALSMLEYTKFDLIITDYDLPVLTGLDLLKRIKKKYPEVPVIFYTGQGNEKVAREAFICGVSDYIKKSIREIAHWEKFENAIRNAIEKRITAEKAKESQRRLETLIQNIPGMVYRCKNDKSWTMEFVSENVIQLTGYTPEELVDNNSVTYSSLIHPDDRKPIWSDIQDRILNGKSFNMEYRIISKSGKIKHVMEWGRPVSDENGKLIALEGVIIDDTSRRKAEEKRLKSEREKRESEEKYRILFEQANDAVFLETLKGKILEVNKKACDMLGYEREELLKLSVFDLVPREVRDRLPVFLKDLISKGEFRAEAINQKKDGSLIPVETSGRVTEINGKKRVLTIVRDISDRINANVVLRKSKIAIEKAPYGIAVISQKGEISIYNRKLEEITGYEASMIPDIKTGWNYLIPEETRRKELLNAWDKITIQEDYESERELEIVRRDGEKRTLKIFGKTIDKDEILVFILDITDRKRYYPGPKGILL